MAGPKVVSLSQLSHRQINLLLASNVFGCIATGLVSWGVGTAWSRVFIAIHSVLGVSLLILTPAKTRGSVRTGLRRPRATRIISVAFGVMILATIGLGFSHSTGAWAGVGYWTSLWTHFLFAFVAVPMLIWHMVSRQQRPRRVDLDRRLLLGAGSAAAISAVAVGTVEVGIRVLGATGASRRFTGSHEVGSFAPDQMPTVAWINDRSPRVPRDEWMLRVDGVEVDIVDLEQLTQPVEATLDCTGGWYSTQRWDAVSVRHLLADISPDDLTRSFRVTSSNGYSRIFPMSDAASVYLATGYDGLPLRAGHGAPVRLIAPGRRGPWWIKWVESIELTDRAWFLQLPFPPT